MKIRYNILPAIALIILTSLLARVVSSQTFEFLPGAKYDQSIPTLKAVAGHGWAERITMHHESERYLQALQQASGGRMKLIRYGETWEGKSLYVMAIGSAGNLARIDEIQSGLRRLADPRTLATGEADRLIGTLPSVVWLICGVHGNEISGVDAGLLTAYHLLAAKGDPLVEMALKNSIILIDPMQNPDGRDRFINYFRQNLGLEPQADPQSAEHNEVWPSGRVNHYLFDMNRDWFAQTQPETRGRAKFFLSWYPQVVADLHEMGSNSSYYFAPPALPWNPNLTSRQIDWLTRLGRNNGSWFDRFGFDYYTRENYDSFYPGYGEGWPLFHGAIGMTYEQASVRGLTVRRDDETTMTYRDSVHHHFIAALSTIEMTAKNRLELLRHFYDHRRSAIEEGKSGPIREFVITPGADPGRAAKLVRTLMLSGIEVRRASAAFSNERTRDYNDGELQPRQFPAGSYIVSLAQPAKRLAKTLLERATPQDKEFLDEQRRRYERRQSEQFYDVTAWSLPLIYDQPCFVTEEVSRVETVLLTEPPSLKGAIRGEKAKLAYLIPWGTQAAGMALADLFRHDFRVHSGDKPFRLNGRDFPAGTLIVKVKDNPETLHQHVARIASEQGIEIESTDTAWVDSGPNFGSSNVNYLPRPRIALVWNLPTSPNSAGWTRYVIERQFGYPVTTIRADQLRLADLSRYNVIILPDSFSGYSAQLGDGAPIREWVQRGGVLIGVAGAVNWLADEKISLLAIKREKREKPDPKSEKRENGTDSAPRDPVAKAIEPVDEYPSSTPGAILRVRVDRDHWLGFGYGETTTVMVDSNRIYGLIRLDRGTNVGTYLAPEKMVVSGHLWDDARKQLPNKAFLVHSRTGRGHVIGFVEDPNYRAFMDGLNGFVMNAIFLGPGH
ncbi:MAG: hypothetical protein RIR52_1685 [Acidobacteriota bacterium]